MIKWWSVFGVLKTSMSDGQTHFKIKTDWMVGKGLMVPHLFTIPSGKWCKGNMKRLGRDLFCVFRPALFELQTYSQNFSDLILIVQHALKNHSWERNENICPFAAFMKRESTTSIRTSPRSIAVTPVMVTEVQLKSLLNFEMLKKFCGDLYPLV